MSEVQILVPPMGESIVEAVIAHWLKKAGDQVAVDEPVVELETDKITMEVAASAAGVLETILHPEGAIVKIGDVLGTITPGAAASPPASEKKGAPPTPTREVHFASPAAVRRAAEKGVDLTQVSGTGKGGRITKEDVVGEPLPMGSSTPADPTERRVKMSRLRLRIAERLKASQNTAAILTTFNEIDMSAVMALRTEYKEEFEQHHGVKLGFMSFFTRAVIQALKDVPELNAELQGDEIIYRSVYHIGIAVGTDAGLVVPVVKDAARYTFAEIEQHIADLGMRARAGKLAMEDLTGGTFTISNGGVYGSLLSTPILNPPQSGILGLHKIEKRPVVVEDAIVIRPMMYVALSYDHRLIDGREAVTFLVKVKEYIEEPARLLLDV